MSHHCGCWWEADIRWFHMVPTYWGSSLPAVTLKVKMFTLHSEKSLLTFRAIRGGEGCERVGGERRIGNFWCLYESHSNPENACMMGWLMSVGGLQTQEGEGGLCALSSSNFLFNLAPLLWSLSLILPHLQLRREYFLISKNRKTHFTGMHLNLAPWIQVSWFSFPLK